MDEAFVDLFDADDLIEAVRKQLAQQKDEPEARKSDDEPRTKVVSRDRVIDPETESEGAFKEFAEGMASGATKAIQGVAEIGGVVIDGVFDTNTSRAISEFGDDFRRNLGIDPVGFAGTLGEVGIPQQDIGKDCGREITKTILLKLSIISFKLLEIILRCLSNSS